MPKTINSASAPIHPNALSSRESAVVRKAMAIIESKRLKSADVLYYYEDFERYLILRFAGLAHEQGHVVYLDANRQLIDADTLAFGIQNRVTWEFRHIAYRAMALGAEYVVMAHNHPSDSPTPSGADVVNLTAFEDGLSKVDIILLDSYVVTSKQITSIKNHRKQLNEQESQLRTEERERYEEERKARRMSNKAAKTAAKLDGVAA